eukprot:COSAG01_NODE_1725_length_9377_cov_5.690235_5_plen_162_part_00
MSSALGTVEQRLEARIAKLVGLARGDVHTIPATPEAPAGTDLLCGWDAGAAQDPHAQPTDGDDPRTGAPEGRDELAFLRDKEGEHLREADGAGAGAGQEPREVIQEQARADADADLRHVLRLEDALRNYEDNLDRDHPKVRAASEQQQLLPSTRYIHGLYL